jgi:hypothetical protein
MRAVLFGLMISGFLLLGSCTGIPMRAGATVTGNVNEVSAADITAAISEVQISIRQRGYGFKHVYLAEVINHDEICIYYSAGYGADRPITGEYAQLRRMQGRWRVAQFLYYESGVIVTSFKPTFRPNQAMQPTARRCTASLSMTNKLSLRASLAPTSGG